MKFFRFIALSKISVACILIISAMSSSAQHIRDWSTLLPELNFISGPWYAAQHIFKLTKGQKTPELYLFLKEAQTQNTRNYQQPPENFEKFFKVYTNAPVIESYLGYYKLHNISLSSWRPAIAWSKIILRVHDDDKVTGWFLDSDENGATYNTVRASEDITSAFLGEVVNNSIKFHRVTETGDTPKDGYEECDDLRWNGAHNVLIGKWNGGSKHVNPKEQKGNVYISMIAHSHSFNMNKVQEKWKLKDEDLRKLSPEIEEKIKKISQISKSDSYRFFYILNYKDQERIIAYYIHKAWDFYKENITSKSDIELKDILTFEVNLEHQFFSDDKIKDNGQKLSTPMQYTHTIPWILNISTGTFFTDEVENEEQFKSRLSLIAHETLGHGIFNRYYSQFIKETAEKLLEKNFKTDINIKGNIQTINISDANKDIKKHNAETAIREGLAVAVEYAVYQKEKENGNKLSDISDFVQRRYVNRNGKLAAMYKLGVDFLITEGIINNEGKLDFSKINN